MVRAMARQREFRFRTWGGKRRRAGRKPAGGGTSHCARERIGHAQPAHVTWHIVDGLPSLRHAETFPTVKVALTRSRERAGFGLVHFSVQSNHLHLIVETESETALRTGLKALAARLARGLNEALCRRGRVISDRYHVHLLRTPREVHHALRYVLENERVQ